VDTVFSSLPQPISIHRTGVALIPVTEPVLATLPETLPERHYDEVVDAVRHELFPFASIVK
jgi:hypothetical protein